MGSNCTEVAPQPPESGAASAKPAMPGSCARRRRTTARCTPLPRPCTRRSRRIPRSRHSRTYSSTTTGTSRGAKVCRSSSPVTGSSTGSPSSSSLIGSGRADRTGSRGIEAREVFAVPQLEPRVGLADVIHTRPTGQHDHHGPGGQLTKRGARRRGPAPVKTTHHHLAQVAAEDEQHLRRLLTGEALLAQAVDLG